MPQKRHGSFIPESFQYQLQFQIQYLSSIPLVSVSFWGEGKIIVGWGRQVWVVWKFIWNTKHTSKHCCFWLSGQERGDRLEQLFSSVMHIQMFHEDFLSDSMTDSIHVGEMIDYSAKALIDEPIHFFFPHFQMCRWGLVATNACHLEQTWPAGP